MDLTRLLKGLETQLNKAKAALAVCKSELLAKQKEYSNILTTVKELENKINHISSPKEIVVSEHAILRYLERVKHINTEEIISFILTEQFKTLVFTLGDGKIPITNNIIAVVKNNIVTTILIKE